MPFCCLREGKYTYMVPPTLAEWMKESADGLLRTS